MLNNQIVSYDTQKEIVEKAFNEICSCNEKLKTLNYIFKTTAIIGPLPPYANFRDALFHYQKICESNDLLEINGNLYTLQEHLLRAIKDAMVSLTIALTDWICSFIFPSRENSELNEYIENKFPDMRDMSHWNVNMFIKLVEELEKERDKTLFNEETPKKSCFNYCINEVQKKPEYIYELRKYLHKIKNHNHKLRSSSSILAKPYSSDEEFEEFCNDIKSFLLYAKNINIYPCICFMYNTNHKNNLNFQIA